MTVRIGYGQYLVRFGEVAANLETVRRLTLANPAAHLLVFPELGTTGYEFAGEAEAMQYAEPFGDGPTSDGLLRLAAETDTTLVIGYPERDGEAVYNACMLATPDGRLANYRKIQLFSREKLCFAPGQAEPPVVETPVGRVGLMICFDWFFPEITRLLALKGAQIIAHPSNLVLPYCQRAMYARSVENRVFSITANRIGTEERVGRKLTFTGASQVLSPQGEVLVSAPADGEHVGLAAIDPAEADEKAINDFNDLMKDRRPGLYRRLTDRREFER